MSERFKPNMTFFLFHLKSAVVKSLLKCVTSKGKVFKWRQALHAAMLQASPPVNLSSPAPKIVTREDVKVQFIQGCCYCNVR